MTSIPQTVKTPNLRPEFYRNEDTGAVMVRVANLASKDIYEAKAQPEHIKQFPDAYEAFEKGKSEPVSGTPLTDIPGITREVARGYRLKNIRNAEELAALSDAACTALGHGILTARKSAQMLLKANHADALQAQLDKQKPTLSLPEKKSNVA